MWKGLHDHSNPRRGIEKRMPKHSKNCAKCVTKERQKWVRQAGFLCRVAMSRILPGDEL
jgi:hypothetical protein